jgi:hypothetical protein
MITFVGQDLFDLIFAASHFKIDLSLNHNISYRLRIAMLLRMNIGRANHVAFQVD